MNNNDSRQLNDSASGLPESSVKSKSLLTTFRDMLNDSRKSKRSKKNFAGNDEGAASVDPNPLDFTDIKSHTDVSGTLL